MNHKDVNVNLTMPGGEPLTSVFGALRARGYSVVCTGPGHYTAKRKDDALPHGVTRIGKRTDTPQEAA